MSKYMEHLFKTLITLLSRQNQLTQSLIQVGQEETEALKQNNLDMLTRLTRQRAELSHSLLEAERERVGVVTEIASALDLSGEITVSRILEHSPSAGELQTVAQSLRENCRYLQEINETNKLLIRQSLGYVNKLLQYLAPEDQLVYNSSGQVGGEGRSSLVNRTV